ncbi:hypothetical protein C467_00991 [Halorubrum hochstenium ATCC 700873]|uniref:Uncharacterized protein n=1 Tax=Halorubrum hochstenium ATCC 700873 TaxID=1227481 RepID=M0FNP7_9EURY|nr:hypothetical protein C467_00991 [Halorubrum hochstenium ATCC 700873]
MVLTGLILLGVALLAFENVPGAPFQSANIELFAVFVLPLAIALVAYVGLSRSVVWWELGLLAVWGAFGVAVTIFVGFLATTGTPGEYQGVAAELVRDVAMFLALTAGLGVPYGLAGKLRHEHPRWAVASALSAPVGSLVLLPVAVAM